MGKRKIIEAAKKKGLYVVDIAWVSAPSGSEWRVQFGMEMNELYGKDEFKSFAHTAEALEWIDSLEPLPPREEEE